MDAFAVDIGAVTAAEVLDEIAAVQPPNTGMVPTYRPRFQADGRIRLATKDRAPLLQGELFAGVWPFLGDEYGHANVLPQLRVTCQRIGANRGAF
jgi:hypothetical protein